MFPFGQYESPKICDRENLRLISEVLRSSNAKLLTADYQEIMKDAEKDDFVFLDPPYQPTSQTANFTGYTNSGFSIEDQERLGNWFRELDRRGCYLLLCNSDTPEVCRIYEGYSPLRVKALRAINCKGNGRKGNTELIISNRE